MDSVIGQGSTCRENITKVGKKYVKYFEPVKSIAMWCDILVNAKMGSQEENNLPRPRLGWLSWQFENIGFFAVFVIIEFQK